MTTQTGVVHGLALLAVLAEEELDCCANLEHCGNPGSKNWLPFWVVEVEVLVDEGFEVFEISGLA